MKLEQNYTIDMALINYLSQIHYSDEDKIKFVK